MNTTGRIIYAVALILALSACGGSRSTRETTNFNADWKFVLNANDPDSIGVTEWCSLALPHDWSIEGDFAEANPAGVGGGALPGGVGWYKKLFTVEASDKEKHFTLLFDGVYWNSEVWLNGAYLGKRPNGYISFAYDLTGHLKFGEANELKVKVDNSAQPNSRWYSGSGIYRNVWLIKTNPVHVPVWGTFIQTPEVSESQARVRMEVQVRNTGKEAAQAIVTTRIMDADGVETGEFPDQTVEIKESSTASVTAESVIEKPRLWSTDNPHLYRAVTEVRMNGEVVDSYETSFGVRYFNFDADKGFSLNGKPMKLRGVCMHHDLGCLGSAVHVNALRRQIRILMEMGVNSIRTSHNPPAPELLSLCDEMGLVVMDEMFDMWKKSKTPFDYSRHWDEWHVRDLQDFVRRDRNHPSVIMWSIGNEILEQWDSTGTPIAKELAGIVHALDTSRPLTSGCNDPRPENYIIRSGVLDLIGFNYKHEQFESFPQTFPGKKFIGTETGSALATRGHYDMPSDSIRRWPIRWDIPFTQGNPDNTVSAYDNVSAPWGSTHEETWKLMKKHDYLSGMYYWTGFDYLGEPTPYGWPSRSSYFGIVDLAGFPKDAYYMYQSEWTDKMVLHVFPHWNWQPGKVVDVWAYYNQADEVELFLNGTSLGVKRKEGDDLHVMWRVPFEAGTLKAVSRKNGSTVMEREVKTAGNPVSIVLEADKASYESAGNDLAFVTVKIVDENGTVVPDAGNLVEFEVDGGASVKAVDNGDPVSHESFVSTKRKAFHGLALAVIQKDNKKGEVRLTARSEGLPAATILLKFE